MICEYCKKEFNNVSYFNFHKKKAKYCLKIQSDLGIINTEINSEINIKFKCNICSKIFSNKVNLSNHLENKCLQSFVKANELFFEKDKIM